MSLIRKLLAVTACLTLFPFAALAEDSKSAPAPLCGKTVAECQAKLDAQAENMKAMTAEIAGLEAWVATLRHQAQLRAQADDALAQQAGQDAHSAALKAN